MDRVKAARSAKVRRTLLGAERWRDILKWTIIIIIAGIVFYTVYPKYYFLQNDYKWTIVSGCGNKITGTVCELDPRTGNWRVLARHWWGVL